MKSLRSGSFIKWFYFGMHIKRWLALVLMGVALMGLGFGYILREVYVSYTFPAWVYYLTLQFLPRLARGAMFIGFSISLIMFAVWKLNMSLLAAFVPPPSENNPSLADRIYQYRLTLRGPKIVCIGGGTGMPVLLRGLKEYTSNLTAIVTVGDDG